jgi:hypothetical protein
VWKEGIVRTKQRCAAAATALVLAYATTAVAQESKSGALAAELVSQMVKSGQLAVAAKDSERPGFFVAATHVPGVQLLVVSARSSAPDYIEYVLNAGKYDEVYASLNGASASEGKLFVQDMGADGVLLKPQNGGPIDVAYRDVNIMTIFNGNWKKQNLSEQQYGEAFQAVDSGYARALSLLLEKFKAGP